MRFVTLLYYFDFLFRLTFKSKNDHGNPALSFCVGPGVRVAYRASLTHTQVDNLIRGGRGSCSGPAVHLLGLCENLQKTQTWPSPSAQTQSLNLGGCPAPGQLGDLAERESAP